MKSFSFSRLALCVLCGASLYALLPVSLAQAQQRWERNYGGAEYDVSRSVQQTQDGGYIVAGTTRSFGDSDQVYLVKTNASGDTLWTRNYGGTRNEQGYSVQQTQDGGYIVAGVTESFGDITQVYLIKTDASGDTLWTRNYGGANREGGYSVRQTSDGGYIIAGETWSFGNSDQAYLIKTNASGDTLWTRNYGGPDVSDWDWGYSAQQTSDGGYIVTGVTFTYPNGEYVYLIKTNSSGDTIWTKTYGGTGGDRGYSVQQTTDGGYVVAGQTTSSGDDYQVWLIKTNASGDTLWTRTYGGTDLDYGYSVQQTTDGGYVVAGWTESFGNYYQAYLVKTDASGDTLWTRNYGGTDRDYGYSVQQTTDGGYVVAGWTYSFGNRDQVYLIKTGANGNVGVEEKSGQGLTVKGQGVIVTPNPFTSFARIPGHEAERFDLYDISGKRVGACRGDRFGERLSPGVYFISPEEAHSRPVRIVKVR